MNSNQFTSGSSDDADVVDADVVDADGAMVMKSEGANTNNIMNTVRRKKQSRNGKQQS